MIYREFIGSPQMEAYFGERTAELRRDFTKLADQAGVAEQEISDEAAGKFMKHSSFEWRAILLSFGWAAYHNIGYWKQVTIALWVMQVLDSQMFDGRHASLISMAITAFYTIRGKNFLLIDKARELQASGNLAPPSWKNVGVALGISAVGLYLSLAVEGAI